MSRAGRHIRQSWALDAAGAKLCACGHRVDAHSEPRPEFIEVRGLDVIVTPNPDYVPGVFCCTVDGCTCQVTA